jgi:hypothetical protein
MATQLRIVPPDHRRLLLAAALLLVAVSGCGGVRQVYWVGGPFNNPSIRGFYYDLFYLAPDAAQTMRGRTLRVEVANTTETLAWSRSRITEPLDWRAWRLDFENYLADRLWQSRVFADVCAASDPRPIIRPDLTFRFALTEYHEGNAFLRYFPSFGAGATRVQWESELLADCPATAGGGDAPRRLFAFADARLHPGGPYIGFSTKPFFGQRLIAEDLRMAIDDLVADLRRLTGTTDPPRDSFYLHPTAGTNRLPPDKEPAPTSAPVPAPVRTRRH